MTTGKKIETIRSIFSQYLLPDCLKPEYHGKFLRDIAEECVKAIEQEEFFEAEEIENFNIIANEISQEKLNKQ